MTAYAELVTMSNFSFLRGASHPEELVIQAKALGLDAIALCDRNSLAGVVRAHGQVKKDGLRFIPGCRLVLMDGVEIACLPMDRAAYGRLCQLLTTGNRRAPRHNASSGWRTCWLSAKGRSLSPCPNRPWRAWQGRA